MARDNRIEAILQNLADQGITPLMLAGYEEALNCIRLEEEDHGGTPQDYLRGDYHDRGELTSIAMIFDHANEFLAAILDTDPIDLEA
jgi:hypothetical protein